ncbi:MAG TPA: exonuclease domain-containing protein [Gemmatimonadaceae bacterium]|nr:exonuclease domain-containing protein [Gemmatimonadaceae bacterium]
MDLTRGGVRADHENTLLTSRAIEFLAAGPADVVDLIGHICSLPGAPRIVAEHMARAMFAGRGEFLRTDDGRWMLTDRPAQPYSALADVASPASRDDSLCNLSYAVVDVETTGGRPLFGDRITEVAAVIVRNGEIAEVFETLVNPLRPIPPFVTRLTNITWDMVRRAPTFNEVAPDLVEAREGNVFVAHNAEFDWRFVTTEISRTTGRRLTGRKLCTVRMARMMLPQLSRRSLDHVARHYGVEITSRHRAGGDAIATARCLQRMIADLCDRGCTSWGDLQTLLRNPSRKKRKRRASALPGPVSRDTTA